MERLLILDSNSLLNRAFYAIPPLTNSEGIHTNAVYGFTNMLFKMKEEIKPDYIVAAFDRKAPTFRHKEYEDYKAGRKKMPPELAEQFPIIKEVLNLLAINIYEIDGFEADDIIGTLAKFAESNGIEVFIVTGDRDALQLATDNIKVVITKKGVTETAVYNREAFETEFGVTPTQYIDVKGLMGDKSDNIPGVPGVGEKTAFKLISTYGSMEGVLSHIDEISGKKLKENLETYSEQAIFSKKLATIMTEVEFGVTPTQYIDVKGLMGDKSDNIPGVPGVGEKTAFKLISTYGSMEGVLSHIDEISGKKLKENLETYSEQAIFSKKLATIMTEVPIDFDLEDIKSQDNYNREELKKLFFKLQMKSLLAKLPGEDGEKEEEVSKVDINEVNTLDSLKEALEEKENIAFIAYSTSNANLYSKIELDKLYLNYGEKVSVIDFKIITMENATEAINTLKSFMENDKIAKVIHDGKNLVTILTKMNIEIKEFIFDTVVAAYLIDSAKSNYPLETLINEYLMKEVKGENEELICNAISNMNELYEYLKERISKEGMDELYYEVEHPLISILSSMEAIGFNVNREKLDELAVKFKEEISTTEKEIYELCEEEFNISSPKQLGKILFEKLDLPVVKKTKTGYSTNAEVLEKLMDKHPVIEKIIYYRQITKLNSTYVEGLKNVIDEDGAIHSSFNQTVTTTGRLSSTEPNLQNIPVKYEMGREIRKVFIPRESTDVLLSCDYSQIELRVLAHMSDDKNMIDAFNHHSDIHTKTASEVFKVPVEEVTSLMRSRAKAVNFGIVYGISDFSLSQDLKITKKEASEYMEIYFDRYPKIKGYLESVKEEAKDKGYVLTVLNRRRFIPEIKSSNKIVKFYICRRT